MQALSSARGGMIVNVRLRRGVLSKVEEVTFSVEKDSKEAFVVGVISEADPIKFYTFDVMFSCLQGCICGK